MFEEITLHRLRVFCEVAHTQSFRVAAENLNITQPTVSAHIRGLENETQIVLFDRGRVSRLTEAGKAFYNFARNTLVQADKTVSIMKEIRQGNIGRITVGANYSLALHLISGMYSKFKNENPGVELILRTGNPKKVCEMALNEEIDFGLIVGDTTLNGLMSKIVANDEIVIVVGPGHPLADRDLVTLTELSTYPFVLMASEFGAHNVIESKLNSHGIHINEKLMELEEPESIKRVIRNGSGVAALLALSVSEELQTDKLRKVKLDIGPIMVNLRTVWYSEKYVTPLHTKFLKFFDTNMPIHLKLSIDSAHAEAEKRAELQKKSTL